MRRLVNCGRCGDPIDRDARNTTHGVLNVFRNTGGTGTRVQRVHLCGLCAETILCNVLRESLAR